MRKTPLHLSTALLVLAAAAPAQAEDVRILGDGLTVPDTYMTSCLLDPNADYNEEIGDEIATCTRADGWEIWCDLVPGGFGSCTLFPPSGRPGPAGQAATGMPGTGTAAPTTGGSSGPTAASGGMIQLEIQR